MITAKKLKYSYHSHHKDFTLLCDSFIALPSEITCIIGNNGSGKTTLLKLLCGILRPKEGSIEIYNQNIADLSRSSILQIVGQIDATASQSLVPELLVIDHLALALRLSGEKVPILARLLNLKSFSAQSRLGDDLASEIKTLLHKRVAELSSGQKQTITIALAVLNNRKVILADEGTAHLDIKNARRFFDTMRRTALQNTISCVLVTHDLLLAAEFAHKIYALKNGDVTEIKFDSSKDIKYKIIQLEQIFS